MPDRVREAVFNMLGSRYGCPGALPEIEVADVFAGCGSLGLEALSRGAASCCFFERDRVALEALRQNLRALGASAAASVVTGDAWRVATTRPDGRRFDLVFLDPPYADSEDSSPGGVVSQYLARLAPVGSEGPLVVLHHAAGVRFDCGEGDWWRTLDRRIFGTHSVSFLGR
jgi:16S rRNA (guanine966-N2)-methyltransferase